MAQTGYTPILIYSSSTASQAPTAGNLTNSTLGSELAINITDGKLFYKDNANAVQVIAWKTTPTTAGGTGLTSYTAGDLLYYASGTTLTKLAIGASGRWLGSSGTAPQWNAPAALTKTDDTNVTLTLGGSASTALLNAASLTLGWTGQLATSRGGTGLSSFNSGGVLYASSTSALATNSLFNYNGNSTLVLDNTGNVTFFIRAFDSGNDRNAGLQLLSSGNGGSVATITYGDTDTTPGTPSPLEFYGYHSGVTTKRFIMGTGGDFTLSTGNVVIGTSGKGIDFSVTSSGTGTMTSELLADYEEGTWTPTITAGALTINATACYYIKVGTQVTVFFNVTFPVQTNANDADLFSLPFTIKATGGYSGAIATNRSTTDPTFSFGFVNQDRLRFCDGGLTVLTLTQMSGKQVIGSFTYSV